jgi:hypothetical protein
MEIADLALQGTTLAENYGQDYVNKGTDSLANAVLAVQGTEYGKELGLGNVTKDQVKQFLSLGLQAAGLFYVYQNLGRHKWKILGAAAVGFVALRIKMAIAPSSPTLASTTVKALTDAASTAMTVAPSAIANTINNA